MYRWNVSTQGGPASRRAASSSGTCVVEKIEGRVFLSASHAATVPVAAGDQLTMVATLPTTVTLTAVNAIGLAGTGSGFQVVIERTSGALNFTGKVSLYDNGVLIGQQDAVPGLAVYYLGTSSLTAGVHTITASYGGDATFEGSTSAALSFNVLTPQQFGTVGKRHNVKAVVPLADGGKLTFTLTGPGTATSVAAVLEQTDPRFTVTGTTPASRLKVTRTGGNGSEGIGDVTIDGSIGAIDLSSIALNGALTVKGSVGRMSTSGELNGVLTVNGSVGRLSTGGEHFFAPSLIRAGAAASRSDVIMDYVPTRLTSPDVVIDGDLGRSSFGDADEDLDVIVNGRAGALTFGNVGSGAGRNARLTVGKSIGSLRIGSWDAGSIVTSSIRAFTCRGNFGGNLTLTGGDGAAVLGSARVGAASGTVDPFNGPAVWSFNGDVGPIDISGGTDHLRVLAGPTGSGVKPARITAFRAGGTVADTLVAASLDPVDGGYLNYNDALVSGGSIGAINVGQLGTDSHILAATLPTEAIIAGKPAATKLDPRFTLPQPQPGPVPVV